MSVDYRKLNDVAVKDCYALPRIQDILDSLQGAKYFVSLDLASGYWLVKVAEHDKCKTAFRTEFGHFQFNVLPFGLCNARSTFQRVMDRILKGLDGVLVYIDDIMIAGKTVEQTRDRFEAVLQKLREANLKINIEKCDFLRITSNFWAIS